MPFFQQNSVSNSQIYSTINLPGETSENNKKELLPPFLPVAQDSRTMFLPSLNFSDHKLRSTSPDYVQT